MPLRLVHPNTLQINAARFVWPPSALFIPANCMTGAAETGIMHGCKIPTLLWLTSCPVLRASAVLSGRPSEFNDLGDVESHFALDDFTQGDVRCAEITNVRHEWTAPAPAAGV